MRRKPLESLGALVRNRRAGLTLRDAAIEVGISPPTLLRIESGRIPDVGTFGKICQWLEIDPGAFLGIRSDPTSRPDSPNQTIEISAHFRADQTPTADTISALSQMLLQVARAQKRVRNTDPDEHP